jgi:magnesium-transporting ATPase (P-type)
MKFIMMPMSSNFGNMFSMAGATLILPFLPMLPVQILLNNLLYAVSEMPIPLDEVDSEITEKPEHWDMRFIRNFMLVLGPVSSVFDFLTFGLLLLVFTRAKPCSRRAGSSSRLTPRCWSSLCCERGAIRCTAARVPSSPPRLLRWSCLRLYCRSRRWGHGSALFRPLPPSP